MRNVSFGYGSETRWHDVSLRAADSEVTGLIGPNGAGKSTLLRLCAGLLKPRDGRVMVDGRERYEAKAFARQLAFLPQSRPTPDITVRSLVRMGRFAHAQNHQRAVENAIRAVGLEELACRDLRTLSGGQRQMAYLAMLLAQESPNVLMDEPFTHLDIGTQLDVADVIRRMKAQGKCVIVVIHDLNLLEAVCDRAVLLDGGRITFDGSPADCLRSDALQEAFGVRILEKKGVCFVKR